MFYSDRQFRKLGLPCHHLAFSFSECTVQVFPFHFFGCLEILILILTVTDFGVLVAVAWDGSFVHD